MSSLTDCSVQQIGAIFGNSIVAFPALHAHKTRDAQYNLENKWTFLVAAKEHGFSVSPWLDVNELVLKHKNEEGGLGVYFFKNATIDGDWIIQSRLYNSTKVAALLPDTAPLSSFRVVTASKRSIPVHLRGVSMTNHSENGSNEFSVLSCCFRAGRSGAKTDHAAGRSNAEWYILGVMSGLKWMLFSQQFERHAWDIHPDTGRVIQGIEITEEVNEMERMALEMHEKLLPNVPICGWDLASTSTHGTVVLEVNLSCNFFMASVDLPEYYQFVHDHFVALEFIDTNRTSIKQNPQTHPNAKPRTAQTDHHSASNGA
eukprot:CAMPEP_0182452144 /NCGR_PEP_ID=MMETSP1172-20130603/44095_1 /TAXON_ID=708627 /ORGANISM="Timspurckia oligopyrenoides, Strain CCMP3278" /LENGTH=314 /DNA_ID=CAMNT_0024649961 /DNA_START=351 /DNA_END=1297 /DNA_ORIENTATION=+